MRQPAHGETGHRVARAGLIQAESAQGGAAAGEESFGQRDIRMVGLRLGNLGPARSCRGVQDSDGSTAQTLSAGRGACRLSSETTWRRNDGAGADGFAGQVDIEGVETSAAGIGGIVAAVAHPGEAEERRPA